MDPSDIIGKFVKAGCDLPKEEMAWALEHWDACAPAFLDLLQRVADSGSYSKEDRNALFFILHLMGQRREIRAFPLLCGLGQRPEGLRNILGDGITETLTGILIGIFDGNVPLLKEVIETAEADCFVRETFFRTLTWATAQGHAAREETAAYLSDLFHRLQPQDEDYVWVGWQESIALLGFDHLAPLVATAFERGWVDDSILGHEDFLEDLALGSMTTDHAALLQEKDVAPLDDAIGTLSSWYGFSQQYKLDQERWAKERAEREKERARYLTREYDFEPFVNPFRDVGRNDPCPCGSGRKFKKCCLDKERSEAA